MAKTCMAITLWHPESPGGKVTVEPCYMRRLGVVRSEFATLGEVIRMYRKSLQHG